MLKIKMLLAAAIIAAGSTAALAQAGGAGAGAGGAAGAAGGAGSGGGAGGEPARPSDPNAPGAIYRGGSGATTATTRRGDEMAPMRTAPTGYTTAPSSRLKGYSERRGRARTYSQ